MSHKEVVPHQARSLGRAASFAWKYKKIAFAIEFFAFFCIYAQDASSSQVHDSLFAKLIGVIWLSGYSTFLLEIFGLNILFSSAVVCGAAFVSRFHPLVTGLCAGLCMWPYWSVMQDEWPGTSWTIFFILLGGALATLAGWLARKDGTS